MFQPNATDGYQGLLCTGYHELSSLGFSRVRNFSSVPWNTYLRDSSVLRVKEALKAMVKVKKLR